MMARYQVRHILRFLGILFAYILKLSSCLFSDFLILYRQLRPPLSVSSFPYYKILLLLSHCSGS